MHRNEKENAAGRNPLRSRGNTLAAQLLTASGIHFDTATPIEQALLGTFLFGMLYAEGMVARHSPTEIREAAIGVFEDTLHYTPQAATEGIENCIQATAPNAHETMRAIIHRGIEGHRQAASGDNSGLAQNIGDVLRHFVRSN
jgi:hypothetical protein